MHSLAPLRRLVNYLTCFCVAVAVSSTCLPLPLWAQSDTATVSGIVVDVTGASIPAATALLQDTATGTEMKTSTNKSGAFLLTGIEPGHYDLRISREGFASVTFQNIVLNVGDHRAVEIKLKAGSQQAINVDASGLTLNTTDASVGTVIDRKFVENMPLNGRSFQDLILLTPGVVTYTPQTSVTSMGSVGNFSVNGQRAESNYYTIDGLSANTNAGNGSGFANGANSNGPSGSLGASTALGTTQSLISVDALQEFRVQSSTYSAAYGRSPGGQFSFVSRAGTNQIHGTGFDYLRNDRFDANNWFNNYYDISRLPLRQNDFGGTLGAPILIPGLYDGHNSTFFFVSYEGLRLEQPQAAQIEYVPSMSLRRSAPASLQPLLNAFPQPNNIDFGNGLAEFIESGSYPSSIDATSVRIDHQFNSRASAFFRFGDTPSKTVSRFYTTLYPASTKSKSYTGGIAITFTQQLVNNLRVGYTNADALISQYLDTIGNAVPIDVGNALGVGSRPSYGDFVLNVTGTGQALIDSYDEGSHTRQWNLVDTLSWSIGRHQLQLGIDYRHISSPLNPYTVGGADIFLDASTSVMANKPFEALIYKYAPSTPVFREFAAYAQDEWHLRPQLNLSLGLRWEVNPAPTGAAGDSPYTLSGSISNPSSLALAPTGTSLWQTTWYNIAPRLGVAWTPYDLPGHETVIRAGGGAFFDTGNQLGASGFSGVGFAAQRAYIQSASVPFSAAQIDSVEINNPPTAADLTTDSIYAASPHLQLPYTLEWSVALEQALGKSQSATISYVASNGRRLLEQDLLSLSSLNPKFGSSNVYYVRNGTTSNYQSLQAKYQRTLSRGLQVLGSYTWSHAIDFGSANAAVPYIRGNSDFDVRHSFSGAVSWELPRVRSSSLLNALANDWAIDGRTTLRSGFPVSIVGNYITNPANGQKLYSGVNLVPNMPIYLYGPNYPGGRRINPKAFQAPATNIAGNAPRNFTRGFSEAQLNVAIRRSFAVYEQMRLQFRAEAFNVLNNPTFGYVDPILSDSTFGLATSTLNESLGYLSSQYQQGGPRSMQLALKLMF